jgi:4-hydroxy-2-oxoheptanedioate aldolase
VVPLPDDDPAKIKQALDIGAQSLLIPVIEDAEQALGCFRATRYPPLGTRGVGSALARASRFASIPDYLATAPDQICLILQVESVWGLQVLDEILEVPGIDGVFVGPSDLAADMGYLGQPAQPKVKSAVLGALCRIRAAGRAAGVLTSDPVYIADCKGAGANFVGVGIDVTILANALRSLAKGYC